MSQYFREMASDMSDFVSKINGIDKNGYKLTAEEAIAMAEVTEAYMKQKR